MKHRIFPVLGFAAVVGVALAAARPYFYGQSLPPPTPLNAMCGKGTGIPDGFSRSPTSGMVRVPAGKLVLGSANGYGDEAPSGQPISVQAFWMDRTEVTNAQFATFVAATGYVTDAEREGAGAVFHRPDRGTHADSPDQWWAWTAGASWRRPEGLGSPTTAAANQPVVLVTQADALAYARWLNRDLPTEAEWEWAARGGGSPELVDREPRDPMGRPVANYWQGIFPDLNSKEDGFAALAPAGCYAPNGYGAVDMIGNVWELTRDTYTGPHQSHGNGDPSAAVKVAKGLARKDDTIVIKGGSFLCAASYCIRYRAAARHPQEADLPTSHVGFRTVLRDAQVPGPP